MYKKSGAKDVELKEVGPRFEMKRKSLAMTWECHICSADIMIIFPNSPNYSKPKVYVYKSFGCPPPPPAVYEIKLGTVDQAEVDVEWRLRPFMNTSRKRFNLSTK